MNLSWYDTLAKPDWTPPSWLFSPVWTLLYLMMTVAALLVWRKKGSLRAAAFPLGLFALQLFFNLIWSPLFFGLRNPGAAMVDLVLLWVALLATVIVFWRISLPAGVLLLPYLLWVSFAGVLNFAIWQMNS